MNRTVYKIGANELCPCGKGIKYKKCCRGRVNWESILPLGLEGQVPHLSARGKNILFVGMVLDALQIDTERGITSHTDLKRAFTSDAVRRIYEAVQFVWPDGEDLKRVLAEDDDETSGLYIGHYEPNLVERAITRHSLYADRILLIDPLIHPNTVREELNPLVHPEEHRTDTLKWITMWLQLWPWIEAGLVAFVRSPADFYPHLLLESYKATRARMDKHPELDRLIKEQGQAELDTDHYEAFKEHLMLSWPDEAIRNSVLESKPETTPDEIEGLLQHIRRRREEHPYYLDPESPGKPSSELFKTTTGANYEMAKAIAFHTKSYLMTDLPFRWKEIEIDRADAGIDLGAWSPFAKAFQGLPFQFLNSVPLEAALTLRQEGRLQPMRDFLRKVWTATSKPEPFSEQNIPNLSAELSEKVREAEVEWRKIDGELLTRAAGVATAGLTAAGPLIANGFASWLGAALALAGTAALVSSHRSRTDYKLRFPAGFFVDLREGRFE